MIAEIGQFALVLALAMALVQGVVPLAGASLRRYAWMSLAPAASYGQFLFVAVATACLVQGFVVGDFSIAYVARNSNDALPLFYRVSALWGAHEGSVLLWNLILAAWTCAVAMRSGHLPLAFRARVLAVMGLSSAGFLLFILLTSNPFERLLPAPAAGQDLNPLLQDPGMVIHPPILYMGYVGLAVPFAFAVAALLGGRLDAAWTRWTRPWTTVAWVFLTLGITIGSWWAYNELGWGGWWFWDPVENASFMPWLVATALIHSLAVTEQRGAFKAWTLLLALAGFSLSLLGTFLVRSGVLVSVHAFASDPDRGLFILLFLMLVIGGALVLFATRGARVAGGGRFGLMSRETLLLVNNVVLVTAAGAVLMGTLYPLLYDALGLGKLSVGPPYFETVFVALMLPALVVVGIGPLTRWKRDEPSALAARLRPVPFALVAAAVLGLGWLRGLGPVACLGLVFAAWIVFSGCVGLLARVRHASSAWRGIASLPRSFIGMSVAHLGIAVFIVGVVMVNAGSRELDVRLATGEAAAIAPYRFVLEGVRQADGPNYQAQRGTVRVYEGEREVGVLTPEKRFYPIQQQPMTEAAIDAGLTRDLYVALGERLDDGSWTLRFHVKPFMRWVWGGALLMALGGAVAASDRRYRIQRAPARDAPMIPGAAAARG